MQNFSRKAMKIGCSLLLIALVSTALARPQVLPRSLQRRRRSGRLARFESDRLFRLARIVAFAHQALGGTELATRWLKRPNRALAGSTPVSFIDTELGARQVENVLGRIAFGGIS